MSRRNFIGKSTAAMAGISIMPSNVIGGLGYKAPSDKLNIVGVGVGGMGFGNLKRMESENIIGLCDVDWGYSKKVGDYFADRANFGEIAQGQRADLVLLNANPVDDIMNVADQAGVMVAGRWYPKAVIDPRLAEIAARMAE